MYVVVFGKDKPGMTDTRTRHWPAFHDYLHDHPSHPDVVLHHGGPVLSDDGGTRDGTLLLLEAPSLEAGRAFIADSPFGRADLYGELHVQPLDWLTGSPE